MSEPPPSDSGADMGTQTQGTEDLTELDDHEFMTRWSAARQRLSRTPRDSLDRETAKARYDALAVEYRRRIEGRE